MKNYVIINGVNSLTITGLAISKLPSISKPPLRVMTEEINGRDGDLITELGYGAYDKELVIGLYGNYDINEVIGFFNQEGTIVFSNEDDKYYSFKIINQIDYEALIKFRTATISLHCQPFKYPLTETPEEITTEYVEDEGETITLNDTKIAPLSIDLKGNTTQSGTPTPDSPIDVNVVSGDNEVVVCGKNLFNLNDLVKGRLDNGVIGYANGTDSITISGDTLTFVTNSGYRGVSTKSYISVTPNTRYFMQYSTSANVSLVVACYDSTKTFLSNASAYGTTGGRYYDIPANANYIRINIQYASTGSCTISNIQFEKGSITTYEPYTSQNFPLYLGVENLYEGSQDWSGTWVNSDKWLNDTQTYNGLAVKKRYNSWSGLYKEINVVQGETYTYSFYAKSDTARQIAIYLTGGTGGMTPQSNSFTTTTDWVRYSITFNVLNTGTIRARVENTSDSTTNATYICGYQLEKNSKASSYSKYGVQPIELCKIGTYQDYIYKDSGKWYLHKEVRKLQLNISDMDNSEDYPGWNNLTQLKADIPNKNNLLKEESDYYSNIALESDGSISVNTLNNNALLFLRKNIFNLTQTQWKTTYPNLVFTIYYGFQNGEEIEITDTNLISQLEDLKSAMSYEGQTNISQVNNDLPFILKVKGIKEGSGEGIINNIGNIYAKPIIELEGTGTIGIYKNGTQYFEVDMSSDNEITIDTENMEAYHNGVLKNRQVIGDYNKFTIDKGNNNIEITGDLTKATITKYVRYL